MNLQLVRYAYLRDATLGRLTVGDLTVFTLEEYWHPDPDGPGGQKREGVLVESCVPDGIYELVPHDGTKFKDVWCLVSPRLGVYRQPGDIPTAQKWGRSAVLIHAGNSTDDIEGCILVGRGIGTVNNRPVIHTSRDALDALRAILKRDTHTLNIRPTTGTGELT